MRCSGQWRGEPFLARCLQTAANFDLGPAKTALARTKASGVAEEFSDSLTPRPGFHRPELRHSSELLFVSFEQASVCRGAGLWARAG